MNGACVLQELDDFGACLAPLFPVEMSFDEFDVPDGNDIAERLFVELKKTLASPGDSAQSLRIYLRESGKASPINCNFQSFRDSSFPIAGTDLSSLKEIYERAFALFSQKEYGQAMGIFCLIAPLKQKSAGSLIALSACASQQSLFRSGYDLAIGSIKADGRHPRSHLLAGYCALQLNDLRNAKRYLAMACRLARRDPAFRPEQRAAQRQLLLMQFS